MFQATPASPEVSKGAVVGVLLGVVGAVLGLAGLLVLWLVPGPAAEEHARLSALPAPRGVSPMRTPSGQEVIVEGRIALEQPRLVRDFVAYVKEEERPDGNNDERRTWQEVERRTPPLVLMAAEGPVSVVNANYDVTRAKARFRERMHSSGPRYRGLAAFDQVFVHGRVVGPGRLYAIAVGSGTHASYLSDLAAEARTAWWIGTGVGIAGAALVVTGVILLAISPGGSRESAS